MKAPEPPTPPDPVATANAQGQMNDQTARLNAQLNRVNQQTPFGNITFSQPAPDQWNLSTELSPSGQRQLDLSNQARELYGQAATQQLRSSGQALANPFAFQAPMGSEPAMSRDAAEAALMARLNPQLERDRVTLESRLINQGLTAGGEAWANALNDYNRQSNDARLAVIAQAGGEQGRAAQLRQAALQEQLAIRAQPLNEAAALLTGQQVQVPGAQPVSQANSTPADYQGAVAQNYAGRVQNWQAQAQEAAAMNNAIGQLVGNAFSFGMGTPMGMRASKSMFG